jgi:hypothetical protein
MMNRKRFLGRGRLSVVGLIILLVSTCPTGPVGAQRISRFIHIPAYDAMMRKVPIDPLSALGRTAPEVLDRIKQAFSPSETGSDALGGFSAGYDLSAPGSFLARDTSTFWGGHRATISKQPLTHFEHPDLAMPPP